MKVDNLKIIISMVVFMVPFIVYTQNVNWKKMKEPITQIPNDIQRIGQYLVMTTMQSSPLVEW